MQILSKILKQQALKNQLNRNKSLFVPSAWHSFADQWGLYSFDGGGAGWLNLRGVGREAKNNQRRRRHRHRIPLSNARWWLIEPFLLLSKRVLSLYTRFGIIWHNKARCCMSLGMRRRRLPTSTSRSLKINFTPINCTTALRLLLIKNTSIPTRRRNAAGLSFSTTGTKG